MHCGLMLFATHMPHKIRLQGEPNFDKAGHMQQQQHNLMRLLQTSQIWDGGDLLNYIQQALQAVPPFAMHSMLFVALLWLQTCTTPSCGLSCMTSATKAALLGFRFRV